MSDDEKRRRRIQRLIMEIRSNKASHGKAQDVPERKIEPLAERLSYWAMQYDNYSLVELDNQIGFLVGQHRELRLTREERLAETRDLDAPKADPKSADFRNLTAEQKLERGNEIERLKQAEVQRAKVDRQ